MKLYYAPSSRAVRIAWLLEELGLSYEIEKFQLGDKEMREPGYRAVHPMGRVPALEDGDVTLFESGAIVQYILARHAGGRLQPAVDSPDFPVFLQWLHYAEGMIMPPMNQIVVETKLLAPDRRSEVHAKRAVKLLAQMLYAVDAHMEGREFLAGAFSGADVMTGHACMMAGRLGADLSDKPNVAAYNERLAARPAFQKAESL
ncbi:glutathione S-transferase family protein [Chachezhania antarctica]|uniref:glutathione S-transferase family protein n=1 Tax=Chachezhania antarctica TaxID=2340860 RepID=UPI000EB06372|nr:glutathione S-transferase family protein [Chachezhania antarctica]|tara:strand:- start:602 stop:1207 length:606 start_codon:yes stop_codon:yes gene_type:complete